MYKSEKAGKTRKIRVILNAAGGLCSLGLLNSALALPPLSRASSSLPANESAIATSAVGRSLLRQQDTIRAPLDLRPPQELLSATVHQGAGTFASAPFPSAIHHLELGSTDSRGADRDAEDGTRLPSFGARALSFQEASQAR